MANKKASKKVAAKKVSHKKGEGAKVEAVEVKASAAAVAKPEPTPAPAIADEPVCYTRALAGNRSPAKSGKNRHMTIKQHQALNK